MAGSTRRKSKNLLKKHIRKPKKQKQNQAPATTHKEEAVSGNDKAEDLRSFKHSHTHGWSWRLGPGVQGRWPLGCLVGARSGCARPTLPGKLSLSNLRTFHQSKAQGVLDYATETLYPSWQHLLIKRPGTAGREGKEWSCSPLSTACPTAAAKLSEVTGWTLTPARIPVVLEQVIKTEMTYNDNYLRKMLLLKMSSAP